MREPKQCWGLNRAKVRQWLPVALLALAFLTGAFARIILSPLSATATPESEQIGDAMLAAVPDGAVSATALNSALSCQREADGLHCTTRDPDGIQEVQVLDAVSGLKVAKASPQPVCSTTDFNFTVPASSATHDLLFRVVDCAARVSGQSTGRDWYTAQVAGAAAAPRPGNAASSGVQVTVLGPRATR